MQGINKRTKSPIVGACQRLTGTSPVIFHDRKDEDGRPAWELAGGTEVFWDDARTETTDDGQVVFLDRNGHEVPHDDVEIEPEEATRGETVETIKRLNAVAQPLGLEVKPVSGADYDKGFRCAIVKHHRGGSTRIGTMCRSLDEARQMLEAFTHGRNDRPGGEDAPGQDARRA